MPTYNRASLILRSVRSVLNQTYPDFEFLIIDAGSTDQTSEVILNIDDPRIRYKKINHWGGPARPRNLGIEWSRYSYIALIDDDDEWYPEQLETLVHHIKAKPDAVLFFHDRKIVFDQVVLPSSESKVAPKQVTTISILLGQIRIPNSATVFRKEVVQLIGGISERLEDISVEDLDLWIRLSQKGPVQFVDQVLSNYISESNNRQLSDNSKFLTAALNVRQRHALNWVVENPMDKTIIATGLTRHYCSVALQFAKLRRPQTSCLIMARFFRFLWTLAYAT